MSLTINLLRPKYAEALTRSSEILHHVLTVPASEVTHIR